MNRYECVIVGGGHGGAQAAQALRQAGFGGSIAIIGEEADIPYDRPSVSKDYLSGARCFDRIVLRPEDFWAQRAIDLKLGLRVVSVDACAHTVTCDTGETIGYGQLIWSAGGRARGLSCPGADLPGVFTLRSRTDADALIKRLEGACRAVIIGGGYIGLEAAAVLRARGVDVTLLEMQDRVLARVTAAPVSRFYQEYHQSKGVDIRPGTGVAAITGAGQVEGVTLEGGGTLPADLVIVGVGIDPEVSVLRAAGAETANGIVVDAFCRTTLTDVYCIGDCALLRDGPGIRIESVQNATDQASAVARTICGDPKPYAALPWFWSNQYDLKLQTIGLNTSHDDWVLRGDPATASFSLAYLKDGRLIALDCVNRPRDFVQGRKAIEMGLKPDLNALADPDMQLRAFVTR